MRLALAVSAIALLGGCAGGFGPAGAASGEAARPPVPAQWQAPLTQPDGLADLTRWWSQFNDPLLDQLVSDAQKVSPTVSSARLRIEQSRAARTAADASMLPKVDATTSVQRGAYDSTGTAATNASGSIVASWELDLFGANAAERDAARAQFEGAQAMWHDARISVAAEVATQYTALRACEAATVQRRIDADSRTETARLTGLTARAGFDSPSNESLARATAAQSRALLLQQRTQCDSIVKALVALTARPEPPLREALAASRGVIAEPRAIAVPAVPGALLQQRPDLANAERQVMAAAANITQTQADRLPRIRLSGSVGAIHNKGGGFSNLSGFGVPSIEGNGPTWSIGPLSVSMPLFDGGARAANVDAARAQLTDASAQYAATVRRAVQDVELALLTLQGTAEREADVSAAAASYADTLRATEARQRGGLGSLFELEEVRRYSVQAQLALVDLKRERVDGWISLYRALGGGWNAQAPDAPPADTLAASTPAAPSTPAAASGEPTAR
jgi:NodT family efflux transporter outer membrane factor (OMF) lipoprotein